MSADAACLCCLAILHSKFKRDRSTFQNSVRGSFQPLHSCMFCSLAATSSPHLLKWLAACCCAGEALAAMSL